jgi:hypothetical protein
MTNANKEDINYSQFLSYFFEIIFKYSKDMVVLEYGCQWNSDIKKMSEDVGFKHNGSTVCFYKSGSKMKPCDLHFLSKKTDITLTNEFISNCQKKEDLKLVEYIFDYLNINKSGLCLDPMCGMGFTAQAAKNRGMRFFGNELNSKRLEKTINRLKK